MALVRERNDIPVRGKQERIYCTIRNQIKSGELQPGDQLPARVIIQRVHSTTPVTVQRSFDRLRRAGFIETHERVGSFVARNPPHLCRYGLVFPGVPVCNEDIRFMKVLTALAKKLSENDERRSIAIYSKDSRYSPCGDVAQIERDIADGSLAGIIKMSKNIEYSFLDNILTTKIPVVGFESQNAGCSGITTVTFNYSSVIARAVERLASQGRNRIAIISTPEWIDSHAQMFYRAMDKFGLQVREEWIQVAPYLGARAWGEHLTRLMFALPHKERPDGLIISDDNLLSAAYNGILGAGVTPGVDLDIVSHCNHPVQEPPPSGVEFLGFDIQKLIALGIKHIDAFHNGSPMPKHLRLQAFFQDELKKV